jgi:predicted amidohydrolase
MKRELMSVMLGASFLVPVAADAQRARATRVGQPAPVTVSGRLANCRAPAKARAFDCRSRVVYSSRASYAPAYRGHVWIRADWGRIRLVRVHAQRRDRFLNQSELRDILGLRAVHRVRDEGRRAGLRGALRGLWFDAGRDGRVLVVRMEGVDVAEFVDFDRDGIVDEIFLVRPGRDRRFVGVR